MGYTTIDPATGEQLNSYDTLTDEELDERLHTAHTTWATDCRHRPVRERADILRGAETRPLREVDGRAQPTQSQR